MGAPASAQTTSESARVEQIAREAAQKFAEARLAGRTETKRQTRPTVPPPPPGARVELTLDAAVERALDRNLDLAVERLTPQTYDFSLAALDATFRPNFVSTFGLRSQTSFTRSQTAGGDILSTDTLTGNNGVQQNVKWGGGSYAIGFNNNRQEQSDLFATRNPVLNTSLTAAFSQPLLRNFRTDAVRTQLKITKINQEMSETSLRATVVRTVAERPQRVLGSRLRDSGRRSRAELAGCSPPSSLKTTARVSKSARWRRSTSRRQRPSRRRAVRPLPRHARRMARRNSRSSDSSSTAPKTRIGRPTSNRSIVRPIRRRRSMWLVPYRRALSSRTDLEQSKKQIQSNDVSIRSLSDAQFPALDLTASYGVAGIGGTQFVRPPGSALGAAPSQIIPSGFSDALSLLGKRTRADVELPPQLQLSDWHEPGRSRRPRERVCSSARRLRRAGSSNCRLPLRSPTRRCSWTATASGSRRPRRQRILPISVSRPNRAGSRWASRRTSSSCRRSAICVTPRTPSCEPCSTIGARRWNSNACRKSRRQALSASPTSCPATQRRRVRTWVLEATSVAVVITRLAIRESGFVSIS